MFTVFVLLTSSLLTAFATETKIEENGVKFLNEILSSKYAFSLMDSLNSECRKQSKEFLNDLENLELWALKMHDSTAKMPSGILNGNIVQFGDFDQCINIKTSVTQGQYCLIEAFIEPVTKEKSVENIFDLIYSHRIAHNTPFDSKTMYPIFNEISWGVCVPSGCNHNDVAISIKNLAQKFNSSSLKIHVNMDKNSCVIKTNEPLRPTIIITGSIILIVCILTIFGTIKESHDTLKNKGLFSRISLAFSLKKNIKTLMNTNEDTEDDLEYLHGLRTVYAILIYLCIHRASFRLFIPLSNRTVAAEIFQGTHTMIFRSFFNCIDVFVIMSGLLVSYHLTKKLKSGKKINILQLYISRYIKFTPLFILVILIIRDFDYFFQSPQNIRLRSGFSEKCKNNVWKSIFYLSNLGWFGDMCYPPSHQLLTDMQMYLIAPFIVIFLWKYPKFAVSFIVTFIALLCYLKYYFVHKYNIPLYVYYGASIMHIIHGFDKLYIKPIFRLIPYLFGVLLGNYLRINQRRYSFNNWQIYLGWIIAVIFSLISFGSSAVSNIGYKFDVNENARYAIYQPILWSFSFSWTIYALHHGYAGTLGKFLSWKGFKIFSKISFAFYISQFVIIFTGIVLSNNPQYFRLNSIFDLIDLNEVAIMLIFSTVLTLLFHMPFVNLHSEFIAKGDKKEEKLKQ